MGGKLVVGVCWVFSDAKGLMQLTEWVRISQTNMVWLWQYEQDIKRDPSRTARVVIDHAQRHAALFVNRVAGGYDLV